MADDRYGCGVHGLSTRGSEETELHDGGNCVAMAATQQTTDVSTLTESHQNIFLIDDVITISDN